MKPEEELLIAVRNGDQDKVRKRLDDGVDYRYGNDAALREAALLKNQSIAMALLRKYIADEASREAGIIAQDLTESGGWLRSWHERTLLKGPDCIPER